MQTLGEAAPALHMIGPKLLGLHGYDTHCEAEPVYATQALRASAAEYVPVGSQS
jgi:hypothetical protein